MCFSISQSSCHRSKALNINFKFTNSLIYFDDLNGNFSSAEYDFDNSTIYENVIFNYDPQFVDQNNNRLNIPVGSPAQGVGIVYGNLNKDITNTIRNQPPDIGAYNAVEYED